MSEQAEISATCPNCSQPLAPGLAKCSHCGADLGSGEGKFSLAAGHKVAAWVLIANALLVGAEKFIFNESSPGSGIHGLVISIAVGLYLLSGKRSALTWARVIAVLGLLLLGTLAFVKKDYIQGGVQVAFSLALLNLLLGRPGWGRVALSGLILVPYVLMEGSGIYYEYTGYNYYGRLVLSHTFSIVPLPQGIAHGHGRDYVLNAPEGWGMRQHESYVAGNPDTDLWLAEPGWDSHFLVSWEEPDPRLKIDLALAHDNRLKALGTAYKVFKPEASAGFKAVAGASGYSSWADAKDEAGTDFRALIVTLKDSQRYYSIYALASKKAGPRLQPVLEDIAKSLASAQAAPR